MLNFAETLKYPGLISVVLLWAIIWKGIALWQAATRRQLSWYLILLMLNTMGLLEIAYIFYLNRFDLGSKKLLAAIQSPKPKK